MKALTLYILLAFACLPVLPIYSQTIDAPYEVATWHGYRNAAITFTFDDGSPNQYAKVVPIFNKYNFHFTWFIVTGSGWDWPADWAALQNAALQGHEIASHTVTHTNFNDLDDAGEEAELKIAKENIESHITGQKCVTFAYPLCVTGNQSMCGKYYIAARTCSGSIMPSNPPNFMEISSIIVGTEGTVKNSQALRNKYNLAASSKGWGVFLLHGIDNDGGWSSFPSDSLRKTLDYLQSNQDQFWVETFGNVTRYIKERNAVSLTEITSTDSTITVQITDTLNDTIFNFPLSFRRPLPDGWISAAVSQNSQAVSTKIIKADAIKYIQFDAVPDGGEVTIVKSTTTTLESRAVSPYLLRNYPNPFNPSTAILNKIGHPWPILLL